MNKEELLQELREISDMYSLPYIEKQYQPIHYACVRYNDIAIKQFQEIERLNNIIDNARKYIENNQSGCENENGHFHLNFDGDIWELYEMLRRF